MKIFWGFVLLVFGLAYLGAGFGWWGYEIPHTLWQFWPLILVFWGLDLLTRGTSFYIPIMVIAVILSGGLIYLSYYNNIHNLKWIGSRGESRASVSKFSVDVPNDAKKIAIVVNTGAIDFKIRDKTDKLLSGELFSNIMSAELKNSYIDGVATAELSTVTKNKSGFWVPGVRNLKNELTLKINKDLPIDLTVKSGASSHNFDLSDLKISNLSIQSGASSIWFKLGKDVLDGAKVVVEAGASSIELEIPKNVGVKLTAENGASSNDFENYTKKGNVWYSEGYDATDKKIEVIIKSGISSVKISSY